MSIVLTLLSIAPTLPGMDEKQQRLAPADRQRAILEGAARVALRKGWDYITLEEVAAETVPPCRHSLVINYFKSIGGLKAALMEVAVASGTAAIEAKQLTDADLWASIVADGLARGDATAKAADDALIRRARNVLAHR